MVSTGQRNAYLESTRWSFKPQRFSYVLIEAQRDFVQLGLSEAMLIFSSGENFLRVASLARRINCRAVSLAPASPALGQG